MTLFSIVVPIRNMSGRLDLLFDWVSEALSYDCEVVLVHDYFDQETEFELSQFVKLHGNQRLKFLSATFNSPGLARNAGIELTTGDYVALWDADDIPQVKEALEIVRACKESSSEIGIGGFQTVTEDGELLRKYSISDTPNLMRVAVYPGLWRMVFQNSILKQSKFTDLLLAEDQLFIASLRPLQRRVIYVDTVAYHYTLARKGSLTSTTENYSDLVSAVYQLVFQTSNEKDRSSAYFNFILIIRNSITIIKNGSVEQRFQAIKLLKTELIRRPILAIRALLQILAFKFKEINR